MEFKIEDALKYLVTEILQYDIDGKRGEIVDDHDGLIRIGKDFKPLSTHSSRVTIQLNFNIGSVVGIIAQRLSYLTFGTIDRFYRCDNRWCLYIAKDIYLESGKEDKNTWLSFVYLTKTIANMDTKKITDKPTYNAIYELIHSKDTNMSSLNDFNEFIGKYRLNTKKHLIRFFEKHDDTSQGIENEAVVTTLPGGSAKRKICDIEVEGDKYLTRQLAKKVGSTTKSMEDIAREYLGKDYML